MLIAKIKPVSVARIYVQRASGIKEVHYSYERIPFWDFFRWLKLYNHIKCMKQEDKENGY